MNTKPSPFLPVVTVETLSGHEVEVIGPVFASCCITRNVIRDLAANVRNFTIGGYLPNYSQLLRETTERVYTEVAEEAAKLGADAVVAFRLTTTSVSQGAAELIGYGTAVRLGKRPS